MNKPPNVSGKAREDYEDCGRLWGLSEHVFTTRVAPACSLRIGRLGYRSDQRYRLSRGSAP